ncbi:MAG TPA: peptidase [Leeuwenhoekiella sp.]|nr:peptidase [Leeuwenhoekiella sp.]
MKKATYFSLLFFIISNAIFAQSIDETFSQKKMKKDFEIFKKIRLSANSGLYKHRTKQEIDSIYNWADKQIYQSSTYREFYNIICQLTDFEGSLHNDTGLPKKLNQSLKNEKSGYFPYPIKWIYGKWIINYEKGEIPLGAEIISINDKEIKNIIKKLYKYYTTDGVNKTGKTIGINRNFSKYYRLNYGAEDSFKVTYKEHNSNQIQFATLKDVSYATYFKKFDDRYSKSFDKLDYVSSDKVQEKYSFRKINKQTGILTINTFLIGNNADDPKHKTYVRFLDSIFSNINVNKIRNLIVDVRHNGGGTDPNDLVTYSYLTQRNFSENKQAWISFNKIPYVRYIESKIPSFLRFLGVGKYNKWFQKEFYMEKEKGFYQGPLSEDHKIRKPKTQAFKGKIYLLISPRVASAGSLFAAMVTGNENSVVIGEEAMGGYYGHNGHTPMTYILPKSNIETTFSIVNLEQDVPKKESQIHHRGIIPDYEVNQTYGDYLNQEDTQMDFVLELIKKNMKI